MKLTEEQVFGLFLLLIGTILVSGGCLSIHYREYINTSIIAIFAGWIASLVGLAVLTNRAL